MQAPGSVMFWLVRGLSMLAGALAFFFLAEWLIAAGYLSGAINLVYLAVVGFLLGYLLSSKPALGAEALWRRTVMRLGRIPPEAVLAAGLGTTVALIITVLLNVLLEGVPGFTWYWSLLIAAVLVVASSWFFVANRNLFARGSNLAGVGEALKPPSRPKVVDTSAIIDGRIIDILACNFIDPPLLIPRFVLAELQRIADSSDPLRRKRGRHGLEMLDRLVKTAAAEAQISPEDYPEVGEVDGKLIRLCQERGADLVTTDFNLGRVAGLQNVRVLNVHELANAVKTVILPGEVLTLSVVKQGREPGQGLAYLEDGTMVVIEDAAHLLGRTVEVAVTSNLQTSMGRLVFARVRDPVESSGA